MKVLIKWRSKDSDDSEGDSDNSEGDSEDDYSKEPAAAIRANHPISPQYGLFYFEVTIINITINGKVKKISIMDYWWHYWMLSKL